MSGSAAHSLTKQGRKKHRKRLIRHHVSKMNVQVCMANHHRDVSFMVFGSTSLRRPTKSRCASAFMSN
eukprot:scaffold5816_cov267-Pinguiococcus_pyrenoidosus.AAC.6